MMETTRGCCCLSAGVLSRVWTRPRLWPPCRRAEEAAVRLEKKGDPDPPLLCRLRIVSGSSDSLRIEKQHLG